MQLLEAARTVKREPKDFDNDAVELWMAHRLKDDYDGHTIERLLSLNVGSLWRNGENSASLNGLKIKEFLEKLLRSNFSYLAPLVSLCNITAPHVHVQTRILCSLG